MEPTSDLPDCFLSEIVASIKALQKWQRPKIRATEVRDALKTRASYHGIKATSPTIAEERSETLLQEGTELLQGKYIHFLKLEQSYKWVREAVQCENERLTALLASIESWLEKAEILSHGGDIPQI